MLHFAFGEGTRTWEQSKFEELSKGTAAGVAIRSTGGLELAPAFKALSTTPSTYIWSIAADQSGNLYAATGAPARVYRITPQGQSTTIFEPQELQVQALAVDKNGVLYAATNPDGKVYRIERVASISASNAPAKIPRLKKPKLMARERANRPANSPPRSFSIRAPSTYGTWLSTTPAICMSPPAIMVKSSGLLPRASIPSSSRVTKRTFGCLAVDAKGNLIAGSDGSGLVYQIKPNGEGFVLYSAPKKEITALAIDKDGKYLRRRWRRKAAGYDADLSFSGARSSHHHSRDRPGTTRHGDSERHTLPYPA